MGMTETGEVSVLRVMGLYIDDEVGGRALVVIVRLRSNTGESK